MNRAVPRLRLVIPAYREAARLPAFLEALRAEFVRANAPVEVRVVDDASPEEEWLALLRALRPFRAATGEGSGWVLAEPRRLEVNTLKGGAILAGWRDILAAPDVGPGDWLGFVDADGAVPASEVLRVWLDMRAGLLDARAVFASRVDGPEGWVARPPTRRWAGRAFAALVRTVLGLNLSDPQCGFKLVSVGAFAEVADRMGDGHGFCFDAALAVALGRAGIEARETPIRWHEVGAGRFHPWKHLPAMLGELMRLRCN